MARFMVVCGCLGIAACVYIVKVENRSQLHAGDLESLIGHRCWLLNAEHIGRNNSRLIGEGRWVVLLTTARCAACVQVKDRFVEQMALLQSNCHAAVVVDDPRGMVQQHVDRGVVICNVVGVTVRRPQICLVESGVVTAAFEPSADVSAVKEMLTDEHLY